MECLPLARLLIGMKKTSKREVWQDVQGMRGPGRDFFCQGQGNSERGLTLSAADYLASAVGLSDVPGTLRLQKE